MSASAVRPVRAGAVTAVITLSCVVISLMQTLIVPLVPLLPRLLHTGPSDASWAVTATLLAAAVVTPISGRLGDMYGKRSVILASLLLVVVGSVLCAVFDDLVPVVAGRTLQGLATGVIPVSIGFLRDVLPAERVGGAVALVSAALGVGGAVGLPASAGIVQLADWHTLFWLAAALGAVCLALVATLLRESPNRSPGRFDLVGALGLAAGLVCLLLPTSKGADWGWTSGPTLGLFAGGLLTLLLWGRYELRVAQPLVDLRIVARRPVLLTNLASLLVGFAMYATSLVLPQLLQSPAATGYGLGQSTLAAGLVLAPSGLIMMAFAPLSARLTARHGARVTLLTGLCVIGAGYGAGLFLMAEVRQIVLMSLIVSAGVGIAYAAGPALIMDAVPVTGTASANGVNSLMRSVGTSSSSAVTAALLAGTSTRLGSASVPTEQGFRTSFVVAALAAVLGIGTALLIPRARRSPAGPGPATAPAAGAAR
ncbi:MFS transporter [Streptomyces cacaoi]|uniref:MFS transporter n=1 Tax=Streptomyces cacaoi TaxID=1898 RepID=UPI001FD04F53|nr:MFS transporter [Streptomyces cacaoi]